MQEPSVTWVLVSYDFVNEYQDLERWNLVANLSGANFEDSKIKNADFAGATMNGCKGCP